MSWSVLIRLNHFFHFGKNCNRLYRFGRFVAIFPDLLRFFVPNQNRHREEGMEAERPKKDVCTARQFNHDFTGRIRIYWCTTLFKYDSYLSAEAFFDWIEWPKVWLRFVSIFNFVHVSYFSLLDILGSEFLHFDERTLFFSHRYKFGTCGNRISTRFCFASIPSPEEGLERTWKNCPFHITFWCWTVSLLDTVTSLDRHDGDLISLNNTCPWCDLNLKIISPGSRTRDFTSLVEVSIN